MRTISIYLLLFLRAFTSFGQEVIPDYSLDMNIEQAKKFLTVNGSVTFKMFENTHTDSARLYLNETMTDPVFSLPAKPKRQILKYRKVKYCRS